MRIAVYLKSQDPAVHQPKHHIPKRLAEQICMEYDNGKPLAKRLSDSTIQLQTEESFSSTKDRFRRVRLNIIPRLRVRTDHMPLLLYYPIKDQESFA